MASTEASNSDNLKPGSRERLALSAYPLLYTPPIHLRAQIQIQAKTCDLASVVAAPRFLYLSYWFLYTHTNFQISSFCNYNRPDVVNARVTSDHCFVSNLEGMAGVEWYYRQVSFSVSDISSRLSSLAESDDLFPWSFHPNPRSSSPSSSMSAFTPATEVLCAIPILLTYFHLLVVSSYPFVAEVLGIHHKLGIRVAATGLSCAERTASTNVGYKSFVICGLYVCDSVWLHLVCDFLA